MSKIPYSFMKGMNRDTAKNKFSNEAYYYMENGRILSDDDSTTSNIISLKGNSNANILETEFNPSSREGFVIIGHTLILDNIVLFYAETTSIDTDSVTSLSAIDVLEYKGDDVYQRREVWKGAGLNFRKDKPIRAVSNYTKPDVQKIYWTDNNNAVRQLNVGVDVSGYTPVQFEFIGILEKEPRITTVPTNGNLKPGVIFYAYRLVSLYGQRTNFSQLSLPVYIAKEVPTYGDKGDDIYNPDTAYNSGMGNKLSINFGNLDLVSLYDYIEVVSFWMSSNTGTPDVTIINRLEISGTNSYTTVDEGTSNYGTLDLSEVVIQNTDFAAKDLAVKDNRLFFANIKEKYFDLDSELADSFNGRYDARAYRWDSASKTYLSKYNLGFVVGEYTLTSLAQCSTIPDNADCINSFNNITNPSSLTGSDLNPENKQNKYQFGNSILGGEGTNIKYRFLKEDSSIGQFTNSINPTLILNLSDHWYSNGKVTLQRDEVYRVGIVFYDKKGRQSFAKWIGDIRTPSLMDSGFNGISRYTTTIVRETVNLEVTLKNKPISKSGEEYVWQIVYVKRELKDKSVVYAGLGEPYRKDDGSVIYRPKPSLIPNTGTTDNVCAVISPDIVFNKDKYLPIDYFETVGAISSASDKTIQGVIGSSSTLNYTEISIDQSTAIGSGGNDKFIRIRKMSRIYGLFSSVKSSDVNQKKAVPPTDNDFSITVGNKVIANSVTQGSGDGYYKNPHGTVMVFDIPLPVNSVGSHHYIYGRKRVFNSQYGGLTYEDRQLNTYIPLSKKIPSSTTVAVAYESDTFISIFEYCRTLGEPFPEGDNYDSLVEWLYFPTETQINLPFRFDDTFSRVWSVANLGKFRINEDAYVGETTGVQFTGLYQYNPAYSSINTINSFFPKPINFNPTVEEPTMIKYSDLKRGLEDYDRWLDFKANNFNTANYNYGPINKLIEFTDKIFSFQNNAVSIVSINPRVTQVSEDGVTIGLGTGEIIDDFKYLTTEIGCQDNSEVIKSLSAMYWLDKNKKKIYSFGEGMSSITDMKGMHSYLKNNVSENSKFIGTYDIQNSEVLMTITDDYDNTKFIVDELSPGEYLLFNYQGDVTEKELLLYDFVMDGIYLIEGAWLRFRGINNTLGVIGFYFDTAEGSKGNVLTNNQIVSLKNYIQEKDNFTVAFNEKLQAFTSFYSFMPTMYIYHNKGFFSTNNNLNLWQHDISRNYNEFYGEYTPLRIVIILNGNNNQGEFTNLTFFSSVEDSDGIDYRNETITDIFTKNKYQQSEIVKLYPKSLAEEGSNGAKYIVDTSSTKIGFDWYEGCPAMDAGDLVAYKGELYRNIVQDNTLSPEDYPQAYVLAELCNIRKVVEEWNAQIPRIIPEYNLLTGTKHSDRSSGDFVELTILFDKPYSRNKKINLSDIKANAYSITY